MEEKEEIKDENVVKEKSSKNGGVKNIFNKYIFKIVFGIVIVILLAGVFILGVKTSYKFTTQEKTTKFGLENVGILVTQTCYTTVLEDSKVNRDFFNLFDIPFTESRQIFSYDFEVDAAIDFDQIDITKIDDENKIVEISLPHAKLYKTTLNPASFKVYLDSESLFSRIDLQKHNEAVQKMQEQAQNDCIANKVLSSSDTNAQKLINGIIKGNVKYKEYKINFTYKDGN